MGEHRRNRTVAHHHLAVELTVALDERVASEQVQAPTLVIVGEVVQLREKLAWFEGAQNRDR